MQKKMPYPGKNSFGWGVREEGKARIRLDNKKGVIPEDSGRKKSGGLAQTELRKPPL